VSKGYLTRVLTVETAEPEINPVIDSWKAVKVSSFDERAVVVIDSWEAIRLFDEG